MSDVSCLGCGGPLDLSKMIPAVMSCACHTRGQSTLDRVAAHGGYCGSPCRQLAARRTVARASRCPQCGRNFDSGHIDPETGKVGPGRPSVYCSDECRTAVERNRDLATRELAKGKTGYRTREELVEAINRAHDLYEFWCGRARTQPTEQPPTEARHALWLRLNVLREELSTVEQQASDDAQRALQRRRKERWQIAKDKQAEIDKAWRKQLLAK